MQFQLIDDRKGWQDRVITNNVEVDTLTGDKWKEVRDFINSRNNCKVTLRLEGGGTGKMFISSPDVGNKSYNLVLMPQGTVKFYGS